MLTGRVLSCPFKTCVRLWCTPQATHRLELLPTPGGRQTLKLIKSHITRQAMHYKIWIGRWWVTLNKSLYLRANLCAIFIMKPKAKHIASGLGVLNYSNLFFRTWCKAFYIKDCRVSFNHFSHVFAHLIMIWQHQVWRTEQNRREGENRDCYNTVKEEQAIQTDLFV